VGRTAVIMQPTYLPWSGYFDLVDQADVFVLLDSVQFDRRSWQQRNRIKTAQGELMLTVPVRSKGRFDQRIADVEIDAERRFADTHVRSVRLAYARAPHAARFLDAWEAVVRRGHARLADLNAELIAWLRDALGLQTPLVRSSSLDVSGKRVELLVDVCRAVGADHYLSPAGSRGYIEENDLFAVHGIALRYQAYRAPRYRQLHGEFIPSLSVLDLLLNEGDGSLAVIRSGRDGA
jgi:hypothetical protein